MTEPDDFETWLMSWTKERQAWASVVLAKDACSTCHHWWHGTACVIENNGKTCDCPTALEAAS